MTKYMALLVERTTLYDSPLSSTDQLIKSLAFPMLENRSLVWKTAMVGYNWRKIHLLVGFSSDGADCLIETNNFGILRLILLVYFVVEVHYVSKFLNSLYYVSKFQSLFYYAGKLKKKFYCGGNWFLIIILRTIWRAHQLTACISSVVLGSCCASQTFTNQCSCMSSRANSHVKGPDYDTSGAEVQL